MSTIGGKTIIEETFTDFLTIYTTNPKPILFWDTCGILDYIRFVYRENNGVDTLNAMLEIANKINNNEIYSVSSELLAIEWDDNVGKAMGEMKDSLKKTTAYYSLGVETINKFYSSTYTSLDLAAYRLEEMLRDISLNIAVQTHYLIFKDISNAALTRVALKSPPSNTSQKKGGEIKDCVMWESMLHLCDEINKIIPSGCPNKVFYTVNVNDFEDKSRGRVYYKELQEEARQKGFHCTFDIDDAARWL